MGDLKNESILILSPQAWGNMFISKHHFAVALAKRGNKVYFLNPPSQGAQKWKREISIRSLPAHPGLFLIDHELNFPYELRYRLLPVFHWLMKFHIRKILHVIEPIDIIWSFDLNYLYPLDLFGRKPYKIFHPVDEPLTALAINAAKGAQVIFSVTQEILDKYAAYSAPKYFINHGVSDDFLVNEPLIHEKANTIGVGFSANLLRKEIDRPILLKIVRENQNCMFEFWGSFKAEQTNIGGGEDDATRSFINDLRAEKNVVLHGVVSPATLASDFCKMDIFLICYDVQKDQSKGTNYHKVMEYISTGKVTVSNNITTYKNEPDLVQMIEDRSSNELLPVLFKTIVRNIEMYNNYSLMMKRYDFAKANSYEKQIEKIAELIQRNS